MTTVSWQASTCFTKFHIHAAPHCTRLSKLSVLFIGFVLRLALRVGTSSVMRLAQSDSSVEPETKSRSDMVGQQQSQCLALGGLAFENRWLLLDSRTMVTLFSCVCIYI